jgi:membrane protein
MQVIQLIFTGQTAFNWRLDSFFGPIFCVLIRLAFLLSTEGDAMATKGTSAHGAHSAVKDFFLQDIWMLRQESMPRWKAASTRLLRVWILAVHDFFSDQCTLHASALTFYTLLSIVPVFAVIFGIAKGFGFDKMLENELVTQLAGQQEVLERILAFSRNLLENAKGGLIAGVGIAVMFWSAVKVLGQIESALNVMWDVSERRSWGRRFSDYLSMMLIAPVLFLVAGSASVFIRAQFEAITNRFKIIGLLGPLVFHLLKLTPFILVWILFTLIYMAMPNTQVPFRAAAIGAAVGALLYQLVQWVYIDLQVGAAKQNAIYGSFAALPLFLAWVQISWTIVLFGAELCYAVQHSEGQCSAAGCPKITPGEQKLVSLHILKRAIQGFTCGAAPMTSRELALKTGIPLRLVQQSASDLVEARLLSETTGPALDQAAFQPAMDLRLLTLQRVLEALDSAGGSSKLPTLASYPETAALKEALAKLSQAAAEAPANRPLSDI